MGQSKGDKHEGVTVGVGLKKKKGSVFFFIYNIKNDRGFDRYTILRNVCRLRARAFLNSGALVPTAEAATAATVKKKRPFFLYNSTTQFFSNENRTNGN